MRRKLFYLISVIIIFAGILGPCIYNNKIIGIHKQAITFSKGVEQTSSTAEPTAANSTSINKEATDQSESQPNVNGPTTTLHTIHQEDTPTGAADQGSAALSQQNTGTLSSDVSKSACVLDIAVIGMDGELLYSPESITVTKKHGVEVTALDALGCTGLPYKVSARFPGLVEVIADQGNRGQSGWMYKVNNEVPMVAADQQKVKTGDKLIWYFSKSMDVPTPDWNDLIKKIDLH